MNERALATKLILSALDEPERISSIQDRTRIQKLIYLAQAAGADLGYYFNWYLKGPYSSSLAKDYYNMPSDTEGYELVDDLQRSLDQVSAIAHHARKPDALGYVQWLELVASVHYLDNVSKLDDEAVADKMGREKPHLAAYVKTARKVLGEHIGKGAKTRQ